MEVNVYSDQIFSWGKTFAGRILLEADLSGVLRWLTPAHVIFTSQTPLCLLPSICAIQRRPFKKNHKSVVEDLGNWVVLGEGGGGKKLI